MAEQTHYSLVVDEEEIHSLLDHHPLSDRAVRKLLAHAKRGEGLDLEQAAFLLNSDEPGSLELLFNAAGEVKEKVFGTRIVLFAPLYVSNYCSNNCLYCGFRRENREAERNSLSIPEIVDEAAFLAERGYRRLLLVAGEDPTASSLEYLCESIQAIYRETKIRIVHVNAAPMSVEAFSKLKASGAGVYQCFQETYHRETYHWLHPSGPKQDYEWRLSVMDRAMEGGFDDVGVGALLGLYDYRFEVLSGIAHARYLERQYGVGPHTISVPRFRQAMGAALAQAPFPVSDQEFKKIVAVYRLAVPYAGVVVSTREGADLRDQVIHFGASQISAGSRTDIGGYTRSRDHEGTSQFTLNDSRSLDEVIRSVMEAGLLPSLCTSCYRSGRTGERFRDAVEQGRIKDFCLVNALLSLMEYVQNIRDEETRVQGTSRVQKILSTVQDPALRRVAKKCLERIMDGEEDVRV
jgi:2-iminoacetate synthase